jgi:hypothetical protein
VNAANQLVDQILVRMETVHEEEFVSELKVQLEAIKKKNEPISYREICAAIRRAVQEEEIPASLASRPDRAKPDKNVKVPAYVYLTEGYDPAKADAMNDAIRHDRQMMKEASK